VAAIASGALLVAGLLACGGGGGTEPTTTVIVEGGAPPPAPPPPSNAPARGGGARPVVTLERGCPTPRPVPVGAPPAPDVVQVTRVRRQVIGGWGASVVSDTFIDPLVDTQGFTRAGVRLMDRLVFEDLGIGAMRIFGPGFGRATVRATAIDRVRDRSFAFMRRVAPLGVRFMFTAARAPAALTDGARLRDGAEADYARWIASYLRFSRDVIGVPFAFTAIANEPDNNRSPLTITPDQAAKVYGALAREIDRQGLPTKLVLGDTTGWGSACPYADALLADATARDAAVAFATHPYSGTFDQARGLAAKATLAGVPTWQTEWGTGCATCRENDSVERALRWSRKIAEDLSGPEVTVWFAFRAVADAAHGPGDAVMVRIRRGGRSRLYLTKRYFVMRQWTSAAPPGAVRLAVRSAVPGLWAVAFRRPRRTALVLTNSAPVERRLRLDLGRPRGRVSVRRTSASERFARLDSLRYSGRPVPVVVAPRSVTTYVLAPLTF
jgi:O-glycosyl hydrolase